MVTPQLAAKKANIGIWRSFPRSRRNGQRGETEMRTVLTGIKGPQAFSICGPWNFPKKLKKKIN
jgi:hypothetical protein